jgi:tetratricopeptide (TPR) repeat protein
VEQFRTALRLRPDLAEVHRNLAAALAEQGQLSEAVGYYEQALRLKPGSGEAHGQLGDVLKKLGRFQEAILHLRHALRFKPDYAFAYWNLGQFAAQGLYSFSQQELSNIWALAQNGRQSLVDRSLLHLTLGDVYDRQGAYDTAFAHYRQGNDLRKVWLGQMGRVFDPDKHRSWINDLTNTFNEAFFKQGGLTGSDNEMPVFVVGMPRSGTSLVEQILSSHSQVAGAGETGQMEQLINALAPQGSNANGYPRWLHSINETKLRSIADRYLQSLAKVGGMALRVIDKRPDNFLHLGLIARLFPRARVIHCRRDPLDVCFSCYVQHFNRVDHAWSLEDLGQYYEQYERLMAHWQRALPLKVFEICYEELVAHQEALSRDLVAFCGLEWEDGCLAFHRNPRPVQTVSAVQVRRPIYTSSIGRSRNYVAHLGPLLRHVLT